MKKRVKHILPGVAFIALIAAIAVYCILLNMEINILNDYEKGTVLITKKKIMSGVILDADNVGEYFTEAEIDKRMIPKTALVNPEKLFQRIVVSPLDQGVIVTEAMVEALAEIRNEMSDPVLAGFRADDLYQVVSGVLRSGDRIHIYVVDKETGTAALMWENIFVQEVFNSAGVFISPEDRTTAAQRVNILMEGNEVEQFYTRMEQGSLRVVKALDHNIQ